MGKKVIPSRFSGSGPFSHFLYFAYASFCVYNMYAFDISDPLELRSFPILFSFFSIHFRSEIHLNPPLYFGTKNPVLYDSIKNYSVN